MNLDNVIKSTAAPGYIIQLMDVDNVKIVFFFNKTLSNSVTLRIQMDDRIEVGKLEFRKKHDLNNLWFSESELTLDIMSFEAFCSQLKLEKIKSYLTLPELWTLITLYIPTNWLILLPD